MPRAIRNTIGRAADLCIGENLTLRHGYIGALGRPYR
jgi:hypothetical protein